jgi:hypothetical protein
MTTPASKSDAFIQDLLERMPTTQAKLSALTVLAKWAGESIYLPMDSKSERRRRAAQNMLANGMSSAATVSALRERFGVSARTASRDVSAARQMPRKTGAIVVPNEVSPNVAGYQHDERKVKCKSMKKSGS